MKRTLIAIAATTALMAHAQTPSWHLQFHLGSHHFQERTNGKEWNERNPGLALRYQHSPLIGAQVGTYKNSIDRTTVYGIVDLSPIYLDEWSAGLFGGFRTGYSKGVQAAGGVFVRWQGQRVNVALRLAPKASATGSAVAALEFGYKF